MTLQGTNTYLVGTGNRRILIDAGESKMAKEYTNVLRRVLEEENATIEHLLITHWHPDHIGGANSVQDLLKTMSPPNTTSTIWKLPRSAGDRSVEGNDFQIPDYESITKWETLKDQQIMEVEGAKVCVYHTPGHSTDHASFFLEDEQALFSGDCVLGERTAIFQDLQSYLTSLRKILELEPKLIYPGHGPVLNDPVTSITFYINHRLKRENEILGILEENAKDSTISEMDIAKRIHSDNADIMWKAAAYNVEQHLNKLLEEGRVRGEKGKWQSI
ncbi:endoribonuclease LACTB2 isoform X2 [Calliopsis andreniformis]